MHGERPEPDDVDPDQCPDQCIDASQRIETAPAEEVNRAVGDDVAGGEKPQRDAENRGKQSTEKGNRECLPERPKIHRNRDQL